MASVELTVSISKILTEDCGHDSERVTQQTSLFLLTKVIHRDVNMLHTRSSSFFVFSYSCFVFFSSSSVVLVSLFFFSSLFPLSPSYSVLRASSDWPIFRRPIIGIVSLGASFPTPVYVSNHCTDLHQEPLCSSSPHPESPYRTSCSPLS